MKARLVRRGERVRVVRKRFSSVPGRISFEVAPTEGEGPVGGTVEIQGSSWIFPKEPRLVALRSRNTVEKGYWDTFFSVYVVPDRDVTVTMAGTSRPNLVYVLAGLAVLAAAAVIVIAALG